MTERRLDPTTGEWRVVGSRGWGWAGGGGLGLVAAAEECPLCPSRPGRPPTRVPLSSFEVVVIPLAPGVPTEAAAAAGEDALPVTAPASSLYAVDRAVGVEEVVVYSDDHDLDLVRMDVARIAAVVEVWADRYAELGGRDDVAYVLIFEDRAGAEGGAGGDGRADGVPADGRVPAGHPHSRVHAYPVIPPGPRLEIDTALAHLERCGTCVFCDVVARELGDGVRLVAQNASFLAFVPFAPRFPYEVHLISHRHAASLLDLTDPERVALAELLKRVLTAYDELFGFPLPYAMAVHQAPADDGQHQSVSHLHVELTPRHSGPGEVTPIGGSELGAGAFAIEVAPEVSATRLRDLVRAR